MNDQKISELWHHLHWLSVLAQQGSYTAAAARLGVSKAAMSQRIAELERDQQAQAQGVAAEPEQQKPEREYINVPFKEKDEAKGLGARWDRQQQSWYVPPGTDAAPFAKWAQGAATAAVEPRSAQPAPEAQGEAQKPAQQAQQAMDARVVVGPDGAPDRTFGATSPLAGAMNL